MIKPKVYIKTEWEKREGFTYEQPYETCNGIRVTYSNIPKFKELFGVDFTTASKESKAYEDSLSNSMFDYDLWKNQYAKEKAFNKIYNFALSGRSGTASSVTPLFPFEIFMMNDGFEMISFSELNALVPAGRVYKKNKTTISIGFGVDIDGYKVHFYFTINGEGFKFYQVDNNINNYKKAINGELETISEKALKRKN